MNKQKERESVFSVYNLSPDNIINNSEKPDFTVINRTLGTKWGIEVTNFNYSDALGTLRESSDFFEKVMSDKCVRSRKHKKHIEYDDFVIIKPNGEEGEKFSAIITKPGECNFAALGGVINEKNLKYSGYDKSLDYIDLIIKDNENTFDVFSFEVISNTMINDLMLSIFNSPFREINFLTNKDNKDVYVLLRAQLLFYLIKTVFEMFIKFDYKIDDNFLYENTCWLLNQVGILNISFDSTGILTNGYKFTIENHISYIYSTYEMTITQPMYNNVVLDVKSVDRFKSLLVETSFDRLTLLDCVKGVVK